MKIKVHCNAFPPFTIDGLDISTFNYYGPTNGYDHSDKRDQSTISFVAENAHDIVKKIQSTFHLNPEHSKPEDYIRVRDKFEDYISDKRPRIVITLKNGLRGLANPPEFFIQAD